MTAPARFTWDEIVENLVARGYSRAVAERAADANAPRPTALGPRSSSGSSAGEDAGAAGTVATVATVATPAKAITWPLRFTLPWSALISDNRKYAAVVMRGGTGKDKVWPRLLLTAEYRAVKAKVRELVRPLLAGADPVAQPMSLHARVWVPDRRPGHDVANFAKCVHDALEKLVYVKDEWLYDPHWTRIGVDVDAPRAEIVIKPFLVNALPPP